MVVKETNNFIVFSGDELAADREPVYSRENGRRIIVGWRRGAKDTYKMSPELKRVVKNLLKGDVDERIHFISGIVNEKELSGFFIIDKDYIKQVCEHNGGGAITGLSTRFSEKDNSKEVIFFKNNLREVEEFVKNKKETYTQSTNNDLKLPSTIGFKIEKFSLTEQNGYFYCQLYPTEPLRINGKLIDLIAVSEDKVSRQLTSSKDLTKGNTIYINGIDAGPGKSAINNGMLVIGPNFDRILGINIKQKNDETEREEEQHRLLETELSKIIKENKKVVEEGRKLGLNLAQPSEDNVHEFQASFLWEVKEHRSYSYNSEALLDNEETRQIRKKIFQNIQRLYQHNKKALNDKKNETENERPENEKPEFPHSETSNLKIQVINEINRILAEWETVKNIDLTTLENGKYQNWESDINSFQTIEQIIDYEQTFLEDIQNLIEKNTNNIDNTNETINDSSLDILKQLAKQQIENLLLQHGERLESTKTIWGREKTWWKYLEGLKTKYEISNFVQKMESMMNSTNSQEKNDKFPSKAIGIGLFFLALIGFGTLVAKKKKKNR